MRKPSQPTLSYRHLGLKTPFIMESKLSFTWGGGVNFAHYLKYSLSMISNLLPLDISGPVIPLSLQINKCMFYGYEMKLVFLASSIFQHSSLQWCWITCFSAASLQAMLQSHYIIHTKGCPVLLLTINNVKCQAWMCI